jgi:putative chitinase
VAALTSEDAAKLFERYEITSKIRMAHVLANWAHETGGFTIVWESGAYSASRIMQIFGVGRHSARVTDAEARRLAYNGPKLFDRVYGIGNPRKASELGNDRPGDGWKYRGVGIVQITGKRDHHRYAAEIGCPVEDLQKPLVSIHAALLEWDAKGCSKWADQDDYVKVRRLINGGRNGLADVRQYLAKAKVLLDQEWPEPDEALPVDLSLIHI